MSEIELHDDKKESKETDEKNSNLIWKLFNQTAINWNL